MLHNKEGKKDLFLFEEGCSYAGISMLDRAGWNNDIDLEKVSKVIHLNSFLWSKIFRNKKTYAFYQNINNKKQIKVISFENENAISIITNEHEHKGKKIEEASDSPFFFLVVQKITFLSILLIFLIPWFFIAFVWMIFILTNSIESEAILINSLTQSGILFFALLISSYVYYRIFIKRSWIALMYFSLRRLLLRMF